MVIFKRIFLFKFQKPDRRESFVVDSGFRCHLTEFARTTAAAPSAFVTKLRKFLRSRRLTSVTQVGTDRIIELQFSDGQYRLFLEFFAGGNVILTDRDLSVLSLLRLVAEGPNQEELRIGAKYSLENKQNFHGIPGLSAVRIREGLEFARPSAGGEDVAKKSKKKREDAVRKALANTFHEFPPALIEHALRTASIDPVPSIAEVLESESKLQDLLEALKEAAKVRESLIGVDGRKGFIIAKPRGFGSDGSKNNAPEHDSSNENRSNLIYEDFQPFAPQQFKDDTNSVILEFSGFNKTVDEFFSSVESQNLKSRITEREEHAKRKLENAKKDHEKRLGGLQQVQELNVRRATAIESNLDRVQEATSAVNSLVAQGMGWPEIARMIEMEQQRRNPVAEMIQLPLKLYENTVTLLLSEAGYEDESDFEGESTDSEASDSDSDEGEETKESKLKSNLSQTKLPVDVDLALSAWSNARQYYDQKKTAASKEIRTLQASAKALKSTEAKIKADLKKGLTQEKDVMRPQRKSAWFEKFFYFISSEGYLVLGGKDAQQHEILYSKHLKKGDVYVHADLSGASTVIVKNRPGRSDDPIPPSTLSQAGSLAVCTSSAWDSKAVMSAWWVPATHVSKLAPNGDYLPAGTFNIKGDRNFLPPAQLLLGFGILFKISSQSKAKHQKHRVVEDQSAQEQPAVDDAVEQTQQTDEEEDDESRVAEGADSGGVQPDNLAIEDAKTPGDSEEDLTENSDPESESGSLPVNPLQPIDDHSLASDPVTQSAADRVEYDSDEDEADEADEADEDGTDAQDASLELARAQSGQGAKSIDQHTSARDRTPMLEGGKNPEADGTNLSVASAGNQERVKANPPPTATKTKQVRGKQGKRNKLKTKYADQDDEDRALAMRLLGSAAAQEKAKEDAAAKVSKEEELAAAKIRRRKQHEIAAERGKKAEEERRKNFEARTSATGRDGIDTEANEEEIEQQQEDVDCFVGSPLPGDEILDAIIVCGPWDAVGRKCKWRVKLQPGAMKKGKAVKEILHSWNTALLEQEKKASKKPPRPITTTTTLASTSDDVGSNGSGVGAAEPVDPPAAAPAAAAAPDSAEDEVHKREAELIREIRDVEVIGVVPVGKMRTVLGGTGGGSGGTSDKKGKGNHPAAGGGGGGKGKRGGKGSKKQR